MTTASNPCFLGANIVQLSKFIANAPVANTPNDDAAHPILIYTALISMLPMVKAAESGEEVEREDDKISKRYD